MIQRIDFDLSRYEVRCVWQDGGKRRVGLGCGCGQVGIRGDGAKCARQYKYKVGQVVMYVYLCQFVVDDAGQCWLRRDAEVLHVFWMIALFEI